MPLLYPRLPLDQLKYNGRMLSSVSSLTSPAVCPTDGGVTKQSHFIEGTSVTEVESLLEAIEELFQLVTATAPSGPIILRCNLPTLQSDNLAQNDVSGVDLHDLRALHAKSLHFVHGFIDKLKATGYQASHKLTVSSAISCTLIRVTSGDPYTPLPVTELDEICSQLKEKLSRLVKRDRMYIARICDVPAIVIS